MKAPGRTQPQNRQKNRRGKRQLHPAMLAHQFKPGLSGNPGGRPRGKPLTDALACLLAQERPGGRRHRTYAQALIESLVNRAISKSDVLIKEIFTRVEGNVAAKDEPEIANTVVVLDIPRPDRRPFVNANPVISPRDGQAAKTTAKLPVERPVDPRPPQ
jgi:Family of unknown function (DUF5681)